MHVLQVVVTVPLALASVVLAQDAPSCYWPDGSNADDSTTACNTSGVQSHCCGRNDECLSNGYCLQTTGLFANRLGRGACTDPSFPSLYCPSYCTDFANFTSTSIYLAYDTENGKFCCAGYNSSSGLCNFPTKDTNGQPFDLEVGRVINDRGTGSIAPNATDSTGNATETATVTATASASSGTASDSSNSNTTAIAAGIAVPLSVCLLAAVVVAAFLLKQNKRLKKQLEGQRQSLLQNQTGYQDQHNSYGMGQMSYSHPHSELGATSPLAETDGRPLAEVAGTPLNGQSLKR